MARELDKKRANLSGAAESFQNGLRGTASCDRERMRVKQRLQLLPVKRTARACSTSTSANRRSGREKY